MTFAQLLKRARVKANMTQEQLAEGAGYSLSLIRKLENGQRRANAETAQHLADALGLSADQRVTLLSSSHITTIPGPITPSRLPIAPTPLIGRNAAITELNTILQRHQGRLLTLLGPPGVGKTRLALAIATTVQQNFADGVWWVTLAPLQTPELLVPTILRFLDAMSSSAGTPLDQLIMRIGSHTLLLVLDNCEHLLPDASQPLAILLERCPQLVIIATSRLPLRLRAEHRYHVVPLALPMNGTQSKKTNGQLIVSPAQQIHTSKGELLSLRTIAAAPAVKLFVERAAAVNSEFALAAHNAQTVTAIVSRLDGLPLAIELAAAQMDRLEIQELLARLDQRFDLLNDGPHDLPDRQRTLQAAIAWSYDLLDSAARMAFVRLGVFVGGFTDEAALALGCRAWLELLSQAGLLVAESSRWSLLETLRAFALERLVADMASDATHRAHASFFCSFVEQAEEGVLSSNQRIWFTQIDAEIGNIRAALAWSVRTDAQLALRISSALYLYWALRAISSEGLEWMQRALDQAQTQLDATPPNPIEFDRWRAKALQWAGYMCFDLGHHEVALGYVTQSITIHECYPLSIEYAAALNTLGLIQRSRGLVNEAQQLHTSALTIYERTGVAHGIARVMVNLGLVTMELGDAATAYHQLDAAVARWQQIGNTEREASACVLQAIAANRSGQHSEALELVIRALQIYEVHQHMGDISECERVIGQAYGHMGDYRQAFKHLGMAVSLAQQQYGNESRTISECAYVGEMALTEGSGERGVRWLAACTAWHERAGMPLYTYLQTRYEQGCDIVRQRIGQERWQQVWEAGLALSVEQMIEEMLAA